MGAEGVVDFFPLAQFLIEFGHGLRFFFEQVVELVVVGFVGTFEEAVLFRAMGVGEEVGERIGAGVSCGFWGGRGCSGR
jgi:hypothetical protein